MHTNSHLAVMRTHGSQYFHIRGNGHQPNSKGLLPPNMDEIVRFQIEFRVCAIPTGWLENELSFWDCPISGANMLVSGRVDSLNFGDHTTQSYREQAIVRVYSNQTSTMESGSVFPGSVAVGFIIMGYLHSLKLTQPLNRDHVKRILIFQPSKFSKYVTFKEGTSG